MTWKISHEEFITILKQKDKYEKIKENVRNVSEKLEQKQENMRLNGVNSREIPWFLVLKGKNNKKSNCIVYWSNTKNN